MKVGRQSGYPKKEPQASQVGSSDSWKLSFLFPVPSWWMSPWSQTELVATTAISRCVSEILKCLHPESVRACRGPLEHAEESWWERRVATIWRDVILSEDELESKTQKIGGGGPCLKHSVSATLRRTEFEPQSPSRLHITQDPLACF